MFAGTSAGTMIMSSPMYGGGLSYGHLYFSNSVGLAQKEVSDGGVNGTGLFDTRNGTKGLQYEDNGGMIPGFDFIDVLMDTHFDARGRLGRIITLISPVISWRHWATPPPPHPVGNMRGREKC